MRASRLVSCTSLVFLFLSITTATECPNLTNVNFGPCMMIIGWGWNGDDCVQLGGCGSSDFEGNDYSEYLYWSYESCMETCPCLEGYVECFVDPCEVTVCPAFPYATCEADYCGGCNANFYQNGLIVNDGCGEPEACPSEFQGSGEVLKILALAIPIIFWGYLMTQSLVALDHNRIYLAITAFAVLLNVMLNYWFIPEYGAEGAAIATVITEALIPLSCSLMILKHYLSNSTVNAN